MFQLESMRTVADLHWTFNDLLIYLWGRGYCVVCVDNWYYIKADQFRQGAEEVSARLLVVEIRFCYQHLCVRTKMYKWTKAMKVTCSKPKVSRILNWHLLILCVPETQAISDVTFLWLMWKLCSTSITSVHRTFVDYCRSNRDVNAASKREES